MLGPVDLADWVEIQDGIDGAPERKARAQALWDQYDRRRMEILRQMEGRDA